MAITDEEKNLLKKEILDEIKASSQGVLELDKVTALTGVNSLPAMQGTKVVLVPLPLLSKPAEDAAAVALAAASEAADATAETEDVADVTREAGQRDGHGHSPDEECHGCRRKRRCRVQCRRRDGSGRHVAVQRQCPLRRCHLHDGNGAAGTRSAGDERRRHLPEEGTCRHLPHRCDQMGDAVHRGDAQRRRRRPSWKGFRQRFRAQNVYNAAA